MRFNSIKDYLNRFSICPFCKAETSRKVWTITKESSYHFDDENISIFTSDRKKSLNISLKDDKVSSDYLSTDGKDMIQAIIHVCKIKIVNECQNLSCKIDGCQYKTVSCPLHLDVKNQSIFYPLLDKYTVTVPLGKCFAEYTFNQTINRLRLNVIEYKSRADKITSTFAGQAAGTWESFSPNQVDYRLDKVISFCKDLPFSELEKLTSKDELVSKAKMLMIFA